MAELFHGLLRFSFVPFYVPFPPSLSPLEQTLLVLSNLLLCRAKKIIRTTIIHETGKAKHAYLPTLLSYPAFCNSTSAFSSHSSISSIFPCPRAFPPPSSFPKSCFCARVSPRSFLYSSSRSCFRCCCSNLCSNDSLHKWTWTCTASSSRTRRSSRNNLLSTPKRCTLP